MARHRQERHQPKGPQVKVDDLVEVQNRVESMLQSLADPALVLVNAAPEQVTSSGAPGSCFFDASYLYICVATNTWRRVALSTW